MVRKTFLNLPCYFNEIVKHPIYDRKIVIFGAKRAEKTSIAFSDTFNVIEIDIKNDFKINYQQNNVAKTYDLDNIIIKAITKSKNIGQSKGDLFETNNFNPEGICNSFDCVWICCSWIPIIYIRRILSR